MARKPKAPEEDSIPAVPDADILPESQQPEQTEAPPVEAYNQPPEVTAEEAATLLEESKAADITTDNPEEVQPPKPISFEAFKAAQKAAAEMPSPQQEQPAEDTRQEWEKPLDEIKVEQQPKEEKTAEQPAPPEPETPPEPLDATRPGEVEKIVYLNLSDLHPFKNHPFQVKEDEEMQAMVSSVKDKGVTQPAIVRPREDGGYELVSGHRRHRASELAGMFNMPCIVRNLTDEQAITQMVEDNTNQREQILPSERAKALKMQLEAIKRQGARGPVEGIDPGKRSNEVVAERNKMTVKQVQRFIKLNELVPELLDMLDKKAIGFTPAVEIAHIKPKNQRYIAVAIEGQQSGPSLSQAQRMRELDEKKMLNPDVIDGIMLEEKKEADKVIISSQELAEYFGKDKTPREMKDQILQLLGDWKSKQPELPKPEKKAEQEK